MEFQKASARMSPEGAHDPTNKEDHVCARRRDGEAAGPPREARKR